MQKWKPTFVTFALVVASTFGAFTLLGAEDATGIAVSGNISVDTTWDIAGSPYVVIGDLIVDPGITLTIDPGVRVEFENRQFPPYLNIFVEGNLNATGNASSMIQFTKQDPGQPGWWGAIQINSTGHAHISYCNMSYGDTSVSIGSSSKVNVTDNIFIDSWGMVQPLGPTTPGHHFANNTLIRSLLILNSSNNTVIDNMLEWGMAIYGDGNHVLRNVMPGNGGIYMESSDNNVIQGNIITDSPGRGFEVRISNNNVISDNVFRNITSYAIDVWPGSGNVLSRNVVSGAEFCIEYRGSSGVIENNTLINCSIDGIEASGVNDLIVGNKIINSRVGIRLIGANSYKIFLNEISNSSQYGIWLVMSNDISVYHNNIIENAIQAWDDNATGRFWDASYPLGGNYWSDYSGADIKSGINQDVLGSDGIGDTPYMINLTSRDRYPLTEKSTFNLPPRDVWAQLTGWNFENVTVSWDLSWNDGQRANDTIRYDIYRSDVYRFDRGGYQLVGSVARGNTIYVDNYSGHGNSVNYFYYVCAVNTSGLSACSSDQVGKFTKPINQGWNLLSIPLVQKNRLVSDVFETLPLVSVRYSDDAKGPTSWKEYSTLKPYSSEFSVNITHGLWVCVSEMSNLTIAGKVPESTTILLRSGWNLIGYPALTNRTVGDLLSLVDWSTAEGYDYSSVPYNLKRLDSSSPLSSGNGLWVYTALSSTLVVRNMGGG